MLGPVFWKLSLMETRNENTHRVLAKGVLKAAEYVTPNAKGARVIGQPTDAVGLKLASRLSRWFLGAARIWMILFRPVNES